MSSNIKIQILRNMFSYFSRTAWLPDQQLWQVHVNVATGIKEAGLPLVSDHNYHALMCDEIFSQSFNIQ